MMNESLKQKIREYIENKDVCVIATCSENRPRASTVNYVADSFMLYIVTSRKSTKVKNIKANPNVSVAISQDRTGLQAEGFGEILSGVEEERSRKFYSQKRNSSHHKSELIDTIIKIELKEIMFSDYTDLKEGLRIYKLKINE